MLSSLPGALTKLALAFACVWLALTAPHRALAQMPFEITESLEGTPLDSHVSYLVSNDPKLTVQTVSALPSSQFKPSHGKTSFGYTDQIVWLRIEVVSPTSRAHEWLLELAYPLVDDVTLFVPRADGSFDVRATGDMRAFATRDLAYRNFIFTLEEPAHSKRVYYLRATSQGSLMVPLVAWSLKGFIQHQHGDWSGLCIFYGLVFIMACFNAGVYGFTRQREYLPYVGFILSVGFVQFTLAGHTYQFLLPDSPWLTHHLRPAGMAASLAFAVSFVSHCMPSDRNLARNARYVSAFLIAMFGLSFVLPYALAMKILLLSMVLLACRICWYMLRRHRGDANERRLFWLGWSGPILGGLVTALHAVGLLPSNFFTVWSVQIGVAVQLVLLSSVLADRYNSMRADLSHAHDALSEKVDALSSALAAAEQATREAEHAVSAKDEFMATMSHEFRTPLNPIINLPEGLLEDFEQMRVAVCSSCKSTFELESDEQIAGVSCPECHATETLCEQSSVRYVGNPEAARRYLGKVEQSGHKLLRVVNGILDYAKLDSGKLKLVREKTFIAPLLQEVESELAPMAEAADIILVCQTPDPTQHLYADPYRLRQVVLNLVENAIKFSKPRGTVIVGGSITSDGFLLSVHDDGIGIGRADLTRIFDSFEQVHKGNTRSYGGVGLGLSVARSLVAMHNGELWVDSELNRGSTFYVRIPIHQSPSAPNGSDPNAYFRELAG